MQDRNKTAMGFDFGLKRIGVAVGSSAIGQAQPLSIMPAKIGMPDWVQVNTMVEDWQPQVFVVGNPNSDNTNLMGQLKKFVKELERRFGLPVYMMDEGYSSLEAIHQLKQKAGHKGPIGKKLDKIAAALILESWFRENNNEEKDYES